MTNIKFFAAKKFRHQRLKRFFDFRRNEGIFREELRYSMGMCFAVILQNDFFDATNVQKKTKNYFFALEVAKWPARHGEIFEESASHHFQDYTIPQNYIGLG